MVKKNYLSNITYIISYIISLKLTNFHLNNVVFNVNRKSINEIK